MMWSMMGVLGPSLKKEPLSCQFQMHSHFENDNVTKQKSQALESGH